MSELLPLRAVNAHTFCRRLAWLEYRGGEFVHNHHTLVGEFEHRRVDKSGGTVTSPDGGEWHGRSLWLTSELHGVTGKLDRVVDDGDGVMPVDTKKGRSKDGALWPADEVQLALQGVLLEEAGFRVERFAAYYVEEKRRVYQPLNDAVRTRALSSVREARSSLDREFAPPPLLNSPKCRGCSMNVVCQPDEVHNVDRPRQVVPRRDDQAPVYVTSPRSTVRVRKRRLVVETEETSSNVPIDKIDHVSVFGSARITTPALRMCMRGGIPVSFHSTGGYLYGVATGDESRAVYRRAAQFEHAGARRGLVVARALVADKIANQRTLIRRNAPGAPVQRLAKLRDDASAAKSRQRLLGLEGTAARLYWRAFGAALESHDTAFAMNGRTRRPPRDAANAMVSFLSALLTKDCALACRLVGLDTYWGVFHTPHHGRPSLALDLMEPFRALVVDSCVLGLVSRRQVSESGFVDTGQAVTMDKKTRDVVIKAYEDRMSTRVTHPVFKYRVSYRQALAIQARLLSRVLEGELAKYPGFRTR